MSVRSTRPPSSVELQGPHPDPPPQAGEGNRADLSAQAGDENRLDADLMARRSSMARRRRLVIYGLRLLFTVIWLGSWEVMTRLNLVDPFFVGQPSGIAQRLWTWIVDGTALGPLWLQAAITMEEAVLGFIIGSVLGIVF